LGLSAALFVALGSIVEAGNLQRRRGTPAADRSAPKRDLLTRVAAKIAPHKFADHGDPVGPNRITEERPFAETSGSLFGLQVGITFSELHQIRAKKGIELVHVVNPDGAGSNLELVLARKELGKTGQRLELQGPAINTSLAPGELPVGFRVMGAALTSDVIDKESKEAVSYTAEVKVTERTVLEAATLLAPGAAAGLGRLGGGHLLAEAFSAAVPIVGAALFYSSARWAWKVLHNPKKGKLDKALAVAHAASDAVRIAFPLAGAIGNAAITGISVGVGMWRLHQLKQRAKLAGCEPSSASPCSPPGPLPPAPSATPAPAEPAFAARGSTSI
jgi:hypothetical protein